jgi:excisionase family DNA binding protein
VIEVKLYRINEVAKALGCSRRHVFTLVAQGRLRAVKLSRRATRIPASEVERLVNGETPSATASSGEASS